MYLLWTEYQEPRTIVTWREGDQFIELYSYSSANSYHELPDIISTTWKSTEYVANIQRLRTSLRGSVEATYQTIKCGIQAHSGISFQDFKGMHDCWVLRCACIFERKCWYWRRLEAFSNMWFKFRAPTRSISRGSIPNIRSICGFGER